MEKFLSFLKTIESPTCVLFGSFMLRLALDAAYAQRGYRAIGSELLVLPLSLIAMHYVFYVLINVVEDWIAESNEEE